MNFAIGATVQFGDRSYRVTDIAEPPFENWVALEIVKPEPTWKDAKGKVKTKWQWVDSATLSKAK